MPYSWILSSPSQWSSLALLSPTLPQNFFCTFGGIHKLPEQFDIGSKQHRSVVSREKREGGVITIVGCNFFHQIRIPSHMLISLRMKLLTLNGFNYSFRSFLLLFNLLHPNLDLLIVGLYDIIPKIIIVEECYSDVGDHEPLKSKLSWSEIAMKMWEQGINLFEVIIWSCSIQASYYSC